MFTSVIFSTVFCLLEGMAVYNHLHFAELLVSKNWEQRREAFLFAKKAEWSLRVTASEFLMNVIKRNHFVPRKTKLFNDDDAQITPRNVAIAILADWALPEATSLLIENIVFDANGLPNPSAVSVRDQNPPTRPMLALIALGKQVAKPIVKELTTLDPGYHFDEASAERHYINARRTKLLIVLYKVVGYREAYQVLQDEAKRIQFRDRFGYANLIHAANKIKSWE